ncbi:unnamed protein product [Rotaria sp. Silwood2]|nr:unnamed protein product [Rotaria sp. Silwood2]CAF3282107.1 unnamed protein product [Rotaria sp. Silwood2]CAF4297211.1 unnamed protein product [Rotaria sp. Silwood2]CAF4325366.1 unnamed protein product [Rotaria sp. Silwood2]
MDTIGQTQVSDQCFGRIADMVKESLEFFAPISGYGKMPLVSLEEAVKPLVDIIPEVQSYAYVAKQKCQNPPDTLTPDESASIMLYTMGWQQPDESLYAVLNSTMRSPNRQTILRPWYLYIRLFLNALFRLPPLCEITYRGIKMDLSARYTKGATIVWWAFSSTTKCIDVLQLNSFLGETGTRTIFNIQCQTARDISKHSYYPIEQEALLLAATQFQVTGCLKQGDLCIIQLKETCPPHPLLQPVPVILPQCCNPSSTGKSREKRKIAIFLHDIVHHYFPLIKSSKNHVY